MKIPALLLSIAITILYHYPLSPVFAETLDITPQLEHGDDININTNIGDRSDIENTRIGPKPNEVKFPNLSQEKVFYSNTQGMFEALPQELIQSLKFKDPTPEEIEKDFKGKLAHPTCGRARLIKRYSTSRTARETITTEDVPLSSDPVSFTPTQDFFQTLLRTRFWQSVFVPQKGSNLDFNLAPPGQPDIRSELSNCESDVAGKTAEAVPIANEAPKPFNLAGVLGTIDNFLSFLRGLFDRGGGGTMTLEARLEQTKYLPGETVFAEQTVENAGFLNFIRPESVPFSNQGDEEEQVPYVVLKDNREVGVTYESMASFKSGTLDLVKSLYPEGMAPTSLASVAPASGPSSGLTFTIPYRDTSVSIPVEKKNQIISAVLSKWPNSRIQELWDTVVTRAVSAGINPAFALAIWIEETGASAVGQSAFGCFPSGDTSQTISFERSLDCFIYFTQTEHPNDFVEWVRYFCGPQTVPICRDNPNFLRNFKDWYDRIVPPGTPGVATPISGEF